MKELLKIQQSLVATKGQTNSFGKYNYRSVEDILTALKQPLNDNNCTCTLTDDLVMVGDRFYIKATATLTNESGDTSSATAFAREALSKKGMDESQITGAASSYARKYALGGLFAIDNNDDADKLNSNTEYSLPVMNHEEFAGMLSQYGGAVSSGKRRADDFIDYLSEKNALTEEQKQAIKQLEEANASA